jgi:hypothetical protein
MAAKTDYAAIKAAYEAVAEHGSVMVAAKANGLPYETMRCCAAYLTRLTVICGSSLKKRKTNNGVT